ncbi:MAG: hypothetical protein AAFY33_16500, partial [Cyanobacteria bacterium J06643_4]
LIMTFNLIDQALNVAMTGLIYGAELWIICAFGSYVVTRNVNRPIKPLKPSKLIRQADVEKPVSIVSSQSAFAIPSSGTIEITVEQPVETMRTASPQLVKPVSRPVSMPFEMTCVPVDWKKWRVADLRRANLAEVCGVRTRPIGSRRNLKKADLIAQYEQQLKRYTKVPGQNGFREEKIA